MRSYSKADWEVHVNKETFYLTEQEHQLLKQAANAGKTMVWFDEFVISIPHVSFMKKIQKKSIANTYPKLPETVSQEGLKRLKEAKRKYLGNI